MVEGPNAHHIAARLCTFLVGLLLEGASASEGGSGLQTAQRLNSMKGERLERVIAQGKRIFLVFTRHHLGIHFGWYGCPTVSRRSRATGEETSEEVVGGKVLREKFRGIRHPPALTLSFGNDKGLVLLRLYLEDISPNFGVGEPPDFPAERDIAGPSFDPSAAATALEAGDPVQRIGEAMMEQRLLPGVGNIIKCEALFEARVHPERCLSSLSSGEVGALVGALRAWALEMRAADDAGCDIAGTAQPACTHRHCIIYEARTCPACRAPVQRTYPAAEGKQRVRVNWICPGCQSFSRPGAASQEPPTTSTKEPHDAPPTPHPTNDVRRKKGKARLQ
eukprot:Hpha_TRINITY_DN13264_c0_g3::TRINITY_DN13264_c0_g3_i1::g.154582::m.154582